MLLSAGGFARYRTETHIFNTLAPRFGGLRTGADREAALHVWLASDCHTLSGLSESEVRATIRAEARNAGDFLRLVMELMVARQGAARWAETTPAHILHMCEIRDQIPEALFLHVIRDGRDVAASLEKKRWIRPMAIDRDRPILAAAAYWDWIVRRGRAEGGRVGDAYCEVRYDALVDAPEATLRALEPFVGQRLDWTEISRVRIGSVGKPNTSFPGAKGDFGSRWRTQLSAEDGRDIDAMLAPTLRALGFESVAARASPGIVARRLAYATRFAARDWLKRYAPMGRRSTSIAHFAAGSMLIDDEKLAGVQGAADMA